MSITELTEIIALVDLGLLVFTSGLGLAWFQQLKPPFRFLMMYLWGVTAVELVAKLYYFGWVEGSNLWLLHIYTLFEFVVLGLFYREILAPKLAQRARFRRGLNTYLLAGGAAIALYSVVLLATNSTGNPHLFQLYSKIVVHGTILVFASLFLLRVLQRPGSYVSGFRGLVPVNSTLLLYFAGSFLIFLTVRYAIQSDLEQTIVLWLINAILTLVLHVVCIFGLWARDSKADRS